MERIDLSFLIYAFMLSGTIIGMAQHLFSFPAVAKDLSPLAFSSAENHLHPAVQFWGGDFVSCCFLSFAIIGLLGFPSSEVRFAFLVSEGVLFWSIALAWFRKGASVGNDKIGFIMCFDFVIGALSFLGAYVLRNQQQKQARKRE